MNVIRSTGKHKFEVHNNKAKFLGKEWISISTDRATELMHKGHSLLIEQNISIYRTEVVLDRDKLVAIANGDCDILIKYGEHGGIVIKVSKNEASIVLIQRPLDKEVNYNIDMKHMAIYILLLMEVCDVTIIQHYPYDLGTGYNMFNNFGNMVVGYKFTDTLKDRYSNCDVIKNTPEKKIIGAINSMDRFNKHLKCGKLIYASEDDYELYLDLGVDMINEILKKNGVIVTI